LTVLVFSDITTFDEEVSTDALGRVGFEQSIDGKKHPPKRT